MGRVGVLNILKLIPAALTTVLLKESGKHNLPQVVSIMESPISSIEPPTKKSKSDGDLNNVDQAIVLAARNHEQWIADRRINWPSKSRIAQKHAEEAAKKELEPLEETLVKVVRVSSKSSSNAAPRRIRCRFFLRGKCNAGKKCRFAHERVEREPRLGHERVYKRFEPPTKTSLFVKLLQSDHDAEDEQLLQFIEFLHKRRPL